MTLSPTLAEIDRWLAAHAPETHQTLRPPATADEVAQLESELGFPAHNDLRTFLRWHNGVEFTRTSFGIIPEYAFSGIPEILREWRASREFYRSVENSEQWWRPQWVHIGFDGCGDFVVYSHQEPPEKRRIFVVDKVDGQLPFHTWTDLEQVAHDMLRSLTEGQPFGGFRPVPTSTGTLEWVSATPPVPRPALRPANLWRRGWAQPDGPVEPRIPGKSG